MGVSGYKYMLDEGFVANSTFNATNACYNPELDLMVDLPVDVQVFLTKLIFFQRSIAQAMLIAQLTHQCSIPTRMRWHWQ